MEVLRDVLNSMDPIHPEVLMTPLLVSPIMFLFIFYDYVTFC
jgi:hypothetical protein